MPQLYSMRVVGEPIRDGILSTIGGNGTFRIEAETTVELAVPNGFRGLRTAKNEAVGKVLDFTDRFVLSP